MHCGKNRAIISIQCCIRRQELIEEYIKQNNKSTNSKCGVSNNDYKETDNNYKDLNLCRLKKCFECKKGQLIRNNPHKKLDRDIRRILYTDYLYRPPKLKLKIKYKKLKLKVNNGKY
jgi:hypothetical protein